MITDGAPQHRSKFVKEEIGRLDGVELQFLSPGCQDLNAIEEVWRQMKHAVLDVPYVPVQLHVQRHRQVAEVVPAKNLTSKGTSTERHRQAPAGAQGIVRTQIPETVNGRPTTLHGSERTRILGQNNKRLGRNSTILSLSLHQIWRLFTKLYSAV